MLGGLGGMMKQLQEAQKRAERMQAEMADARIEASAGGLVTVVVDGLGILQTLTIDGPKLGLSPEDTELLQDAVMAAVDAAVETAQKKAKGTLDELTGGLKLPPGMGL